jgi:hypothetical protein
MTVDLLTKQRDRGQSCAYPHLLVSGCFTRPPGTSTRNHPHEPTTSKPVVPGVCLTEYSPARSRRLGFSPVTPGRTSVLALRGKVVEGASTRSAQLAVALCAAGLLAGCGATTHTRTKPPGATTTGPHGPAMATTGAAGRVGPGTSGDFRATSGAVLYQIRIALVRFFISKGFSGVTAHCTGVNSSTASCEVAGNNRANQASSSVLTLSVDQTNGVLRITHVMS